MPGTPHSLCLLLIGLLSGCSTSWAPPDGDGDGASMTDGDCDDDDPAVYPGATEIWYDGIDQDCDGNDGDQDGDGYVAIAYTEAYPLWAELPGHTLGGDCVDGHPQDEADVAGLGAAAIHPGVTEDACYDGTNADCDTRGPADGNTVSPFYSDYDCDGDGWMVDQECDDEDPQITPTDAVEIWYDGVDQDCDGNDGDQDGDGWVAADYPFDWTLFEGHVGDGDCWDDPSTTPPDFEPLSGDALSAAEVHPAATDTPYDAVDADCAGDSDFDADGDGYDSDAHPQRGGGVGDDCDDDDDAVSPGADERCATAWDDDCDGVANEPDAVNCSTRYADEDGDNFGDASSCACADDPDYPVTVGGDCDDADSTTYPGANEACDSVDNDCDGFVDDNAGITYYRDADGDGYGDPGDTDRACTPPVGYVANNQDCDDSDSSVHPNVTETCDGVDEDCDNTVDEAAVDAQTWFTDGDGDGYGDDNTRTVTCTAPSQGVTIGGDCDDAVATAYPGSTATEVPGDGVDQDCEGGDRCTDLDCDGRADMVVPNGQSGSLSTASSSYLYFASDTWGTSDRVSVPTTLPYHALAEDLDGDGYVDIVFANHQTMGGSQTWEINSFIYWGGSSGYSTSNRDVLPTTGASWVIAEDLDGDGLTDLVFSSLRDDSSYSVNALVYWNSGAGFSSSSVTELPVEGGRQVTAHDLNQDGDLDLVFSCQTDGSTTDVNSVVYWGDTSRSGVFDASDVTALPTRGSVAHAIYDLDGNGYDDIVFANSQYTGGATYVTNSYIYWGNASGYSSSNRFGVSGNGPVSVIADDLNGDGYGDIVLPGYRDGATGSPDYDTLTYVYWGSSSGYSNANRDSLTSYGAQRAAATDLDGDGYLEIVVPHYRDAAGTNALDSIVYWGDGAAYTDANASALATAGAQAVTLRDLDEDGYCDVLFAEANDGATYSLSSPVYLGDSGWSFGASIAVPSIGMAAPIVVVGDE
ncbi:MAG: VCBS repeat-containing protein [Alphaproteobacteria bacterium]|nr:VCBS repeat-containing protein [Alphaproteobacteria bacterium]